MSKTLEMWLHLLLLSVTPISADTVLLIGGEIDNILHPAIADVEAVSACGVFQSDVPDLSKPRRDFGAARLGDDLIICGGSSLLGAHKDCAVLTLGISPLEWKEFPSMIHAREQFALVVTGGMLYAVGGNDAIGEHNSIERFNVDLNSWEEFGFMQGVRMDFCALHWGEEDILVVGGYDDQDIKTRVEVFSTSTKTWSQLAPLNIGRGMHACAHYNGGVAVAGGWVAIPSHAAKSSEWYDPVQNIWIETGMMTVKRTKFALEVMNGTLTALGGWNGFYTDAIEVMASDGSWEWAGHSLTQQKGAFGVVALNGILDDENCVL